MDNGIKPQPSELEAASYEGTEASSLSNKEIKTNSPSTPDLKTNILYNGGSSTLVSDSLQSPNYARNKSGWKLNADGTSELNQQVFISRLRAYITGDKTITNGSAQKVLFDTESYDNLNEFASNRFTATQSGYYHISCNLQVQPNTDLKIFQLFIYKNGVAYTTARLVSNGTGLFIIQVADVINLQVQPLTGVGDYIEIFINSTEAADYVVQAGSALSNLSIHRLS